MTGVFSNWRVTAYGLLSWAIPFVAAFPFFSGPGELRIPQPVRPCMGES
jgi:hypothetical protein